MRCALFFFVLLMITLVNSEQVLEFPQVPDGYSLGSNTPTLHLEAFWDLTCPDCKASAPVLLKVLNDLHISTNSQLKLTVHIFPLPAHLNSFLFAKGIKAISRALVDPQDIWNYIYFAFDIQQSYYTAATQDTPISQIVQSFVNLVTSNPSFSKYNATYFASALADPLVVYETYLSWQYACYKNIVETPTYLANGVIIPNADSFQYNDWMSFIGQYVPTTSQKPPQNEDLGNIIDYIRNFMMH